MLFPTRITIIFLFVVNFQRKFELITFIYEDARFNHITSHFQAREMLVLEKKKIEKQEEKNCISLPDGIR